MVTMFKLFNNNRQQCAMGFYTCVREYLSSCFTGERDYDETLFHNRVERIFIDDHNVPTIK